MSLETIYSNNINYLKENWKSLYMSIEKADVSNIKINITQNDIEFFINNKSLFPDATSTYLGKKIEDFFKSPTAFLKAPSIIQENSEVSPIADYYLSKIEKLIPQQQNKNSTYDKHLDSIPSLIIFGVGTAQQIEQLISLVDIKTLIIVEEDFSIIKASMQVINWIPIFNYFTRPSYSLQFEVGEHYTQLASNIMYTLSTTKIYCSHYINYFVTYKTPFFIKIFNILKDNYWLLFTAWGFYDDELKSLNQTIANINNNRAIFLNNKSLPENSTLFIVGSGPSIDKDIQNIKKHQGKAVIFSCATALKVLEANNIIPDYHLESERSKLQYNKLVDGVSKEFMKKVKFIGLNVTDPDVLEFFKTAKIIFRENDCGASLTTKDIPQLKHCNPTVVNVALSFAVELGFKNIYLFGTDMGYRNQNEHHSKYSVYSDKSTGFYGKGDHNTIDKTHFGNFNKNEEILSTKALQWCKKRAENCIVEQINSGNKTINYYNCSDGAYIENTTPLKSNNININNQYDKEIIIKSIENNFQNLNQKLKKQFINQRQLTIQTIDKIIKVISSNKIISYSRFFAIMDLTYSFIF